MLTQRVLHRDQVPIVGADGAPVTHDEALLTRVLDEELAALTSAASSETTATLRHAREQSERMIVNHWHDPV
jgi:hypothetical protein